MPVSVLVGEERYLLEEAVRAFRQTHQQGDPSLAALSHKKLHNPSLADALEAVTAMSFSLGGLPLVEIWNLRWLTVAPESDRQEAELLGFLEALEAVGDSKCVLITGDKVSKKYKFGKRLMDSKKNGFDVRTFELLPFYKTADATGRLLEECRKKRWPLSHEAATLLVEAYGTELMPLMQEVEKLNTYTAGQPIGPEAVKALCLLNDDWFSLLEAWVLGQAPAERFASLNHLLLNDAPQRLIAATHTYLEGLYQCRWYASQRLSPEAIGQKTGKHPYKIKLDLERFARVPLARLKQLREKTLKVDWQLKTGQLNPVLALELLLSA